MAARSGRRPTISEVARRAGVSTGTVSRYLNGGRWVSAESSAAVARAIRETGYVASSTARSLRTGRSGTVAFVIDESPARFFEDPNFEALVVKVGAVLAERGRTLVLLLAGDASGAERAEAFVSTSSVDGAVTVSARPEHGLVERLLDAGIPLVNIGAPAGLDDRVSYVAADDSAGGRAMAEHLLARGARRLAVVAGPADSPGGLLRPQAFRAAIEAAGPEADARVVAVVHGDYTQESGRLLGARLLKEHPGIDAVFAGSDRMARGVIAAVQESGRTVPDDILVGGFDDSVGADVEEPTLTTIRQDFDRIAVEVVDVLDKQAASGVRTAAVVPVELVERQSTLAPLSRR